MRAFDLDVDLGCDLGVGLDGGLGLELVVV
jgi:hypothetical protein